MCAQEHRRAPYEHDPGCAHGDNPSDGLVRSNCHGGRCCTKPTIWHGTRGPAWMFGGGAEARDLPDAAQPRPITCSQNAAHFCIAPVDSRSGTRARACTQIYFEHLGSVPRSRPSPPYSPRPRHSPSYTPDITDSSVPFSISTATIMLSSFLSCGVSVSLLAACNGFVTTAGVLPTRTRAQASQVCS